MIDGEKTGRHPEKQIAGSAWGFFHRIFTTLFTFSLFLLIPPHNHFLIPSNTLLIQF